jgi:hypothetical protein
MDLAWVALICYFVMLGLLLFFNHGAHKND